MGDTIIISNTHILFMAISAFLCIVIPLAIGFYFHKKFHQSIDLFVIGGFTFFVFALVLEQILHYFIQSSSFGTVLSNNIWLLAIYGGLAAGLFEEVGRFLSLRYTYSKYKNPNSSLMVGAGHGGTEAIIIVGITMISNIVFAILINQNLLGEVIPQGAEYDTIMSAFLELSEMAPGIILLSVWERVIAISFHIALSVVVFRSVMDRNIKYLVFAFLLHFGFDVIAVILSSYFNAIWVEVCLMILVVPVVYLAVITLQKMNDKFRLISLNNDESMQNKTAF